MISFQRAELIDRQLEAGPRRRAEVREVAEKVSRHIAVMLDLTPSRVVAVPRGRRRLLSNAGAASSNGWIGAPLDRFSAKSGAGSITATSSR